MNFDWKNWCRFCGNAENNVKYEYLIDIEYYFKISDSSPKICQQCSVSLDAFQGFLEKVESANQLFQELIVQGISDKYMINDIRKGYNLEMLEIKLEESQTNFAGLFIKEDSISDCGLNFDDFQNDSDYKEEDKPVEETKKRATRKRIKKEKKSSKKEAKSTNTQYKSDSENDEEVNKDKLKSKKDPSWEPEETVRSKKAKKALEKSLNVNVKVTENQKKLEVQVQSKILPTICHICNETFASMMTLEKHCKKEHNCQPQVPCICGQILFTYETYNKHRKRCCGDFDAPYQCDLCENRYTAKHFIQKHIELRHKHDSRKNICKTCGREFEFNYALKKHERIHVPIEIRKIHNCPHCDKSFTITAHLKTHITSVHEGHIHKKNFTCHLCAKSFLKKAQLECHLESHNTDANFECDVCQKRFKSKNLLKIHQKTHQKELKHFCHICGRGFQRFTCRTKHILTHSDERPFPCPEPTCIKRFKTKATAKSHHNETHLGNLRYPCKYCSDSFYQTKDRTAHMKVLHPKEFEEHHEKYKFLRKDYREMYKQ